MQTNGQRQDFILPILVSQESERQSYVFDLIFKELIGIEYTYVSKDFPFKALRYGEKEDFWSHGYLYSTSIDKPIFAEGKYQNRNFPFFVENGAYQLPYDPFATCFYFLSRHEEYLDDDPDIHGRYKHQNSWLFKNSWQYEPIVNWITRHLRDWIESFFSIKIEAKKTYLVHATLDIDNAFAYYKRQGSMFPSLIKSFLQGNWKDLSLKYRASKNKDLDPFNTHKKISNLLQDASIQKSIFFLMKSGGQNANNKIDEVKDLVQMYKSSGFEIGIHPSYGCTWNELILEKRKLEKYANCTVDISRHHFLKINPTKEYPMLLENGITKDFSMGYANCSMFRAGICESFFWFDLNKNRKTSLNVVPFYFMDASFIFSQKYTFDQAIAEIKRIIVRVKFYQGNLSFIFHNESLSNYGVYASWGDLLEKTLEIS